MSSTRKFPMSIGGSAIRQMPHPLRLRGRGISTLFFSPVASPQVIPQQDLLVVVACFGFFFEQKRQVAQRPVLNRNVGAVMIGQILRIGPAMCY